MILMIIMADYDKILNCNKSNSSQFKHAKTKKKKKYKNQQMILGTQKTLYQKTQSFSTLLKRQYILIFCNNLNFFIHIY